MTAVDRRSLNARPVDPFADCRPGQYVDDLVIVRHDRPPVVPSSAPESGLPAEPIVTTDHFRLARLGHRVEIRHQLWPGELDNDLAGLLDDELFTPGWLSGSDIFERVFTGIVRSCVDDPMEAWVTFYRNTLDRLTECGSSVVRRADRRSSSIAEFAPVYRRALDLVPAGETLDLGSCFGFLPILLARRPDVRVTASDAAPGTMRLLGAVIGALGVTLDTITCDATRVPLPDRSVDTVTAIHLLEHLDAETGDAVLCEAMRLARRRVVIAVPFEDQPSDTYGHVRTFDLATLTRLGRGLDRPFSVAEHHGGWLVIHTTRTRP
ncbi:MAG TPA: mycofactocin oligosaccharide methyltransferase MftM [Pseudonocardiaceae bacterium]